VSFHQDLLCQSIRNSLSFHQDPICCSNKMSSDIPSGPSTYVIPSRPPGIPAGPRPPLPDPFIPFHHTLLGIPPPSVPLLNSVRILLSIPYVSHCPPLPFPQTVPCPSSRPVQPIYHSWEAPWTACGVSSPIN
jgi:hypothetical protein